MKMHFYSQVLPTLQLFWNSRLPGVPMQHFRTPKFFFGNVNKNGEGVLVLEDIAATKGKVYYISRKLNLVQEILAYV